METRKIIICRGIQGSGKSTWAKQWCHEDPEHRVRFNNDYESTDDLAPEENNGSATREIYHEDEVVWDNAKLVNRGEIITQDLRNISDQLFHIMESEPEEFSAGCISFALVKEVLEELGWTDTNIETNGWDIDYWVTFIKEGKDFKYIVSGSLYYGNINIRKEK